MVSILREFFFKRVSRPLFLIFKPTLESRNFMNTNVKMSSQQIIGIALPF